MSAPDTNTDDVEELPDPAGRLNSEGHLDTDGPGEFYCPACGARCTASPDGTTEYGHLLDCPRRTLPRFGVDKSDRRAVLQRALEAQSDD